MPIRVRISQRTGSNKWRVEIDEFYTDPVTGKTLRKRRFETVGTKKQAEARRRQLEAQLETGGFVQPTQLTFGEYLRQWIESHTPKLASATKYSYKQLIEDYIIPRLGHINLQSLSPLHLETFYADMLASGSKKGGGLSPTTVLYMHRVIHKALQVALRLQQVSRNVADAVEPPRRQRGKFQVLTADDVDRICSVAAEPYRTIIYLAFYTGLRIGEILALRPEDISSGYVNVSRALQKLPRQDYVVKEPKRHSIRQVPIPSVLAQVLSEYRPNPHSVLLFSGENGQPLHPSTVYHAFVRYAKQVGIEGVRFHDLRHAYATMLLGVLDPRTAQEMLGHQSVAFTLDTYTHVNKERLEYVKQQIDRVTTEPGDK